LFSLNDGQNYLTVYLFEMVNLHHCVPKGDIVMDLS